jgi:uncharacterized protein YcfJ
MSNKHMVIGLVAGIGIATAGGVAAYQFLGRHSDEPAVEQTSPSVGTAHASAAKHVQPSPHATPAAAAPVATATAAPAENCWDEEVTVQRDKTDEHAIAGTAIGAVVGGAVGKDVGHHGITTAAGAAAGAYIGRKIQQHVQEEQADKRTETHVEHHCAPAGASEQHE